MTDRRSDLMRALVALLLMALWLALLIPKLHMREDEMLSFRYTEGSLVDVVRYQATQDNQAPLWYVVFRAWRTLIGDHEFSARFLSLLLTLVTAAIAYRLARRWFGGAAGFYAVLALAGSAYFVTYALEIRPYALTLTMAAASMWAFDRWLERPTARRAVIYGLSAAGLLYTHYFLGFLIAGQALFALLAGRPLSTIIRGGAIAGGTLLLLFSVQIPVVISQLRVLRQLAEQAGQVYGIGIGAPHTSEPTTLETIARLIDLASGGAPGLIALILLAGAALALRAGGRARSRYGLAALWALVVPALMLVANLAAAVYGQRYIVYAVPGLAIALGGALALMRPRWIGALGAAIVGAALLGGFADRLPVRIPYRDLYTAMSAAGGEVISIPPLISGDLAAFNAERYLHLPIVAQPTGRNVWFVTSDWFNDAVRAAFNALERTHPLQTVLGRCDRTWCYLAQLMQGPPLEQPIRFYAANGHALAFHGIDLDATGPAAVRTRLWWRVDAPLALDYSFSLQLYAASGALVAQADGPIHHYGRDRVQTSALMPDQWYIDWRTVTPSAPMPAGTYTLALLVYQPWDGVRLLTADGADRVQVAAITIP